MKRFLIISIPILVIASGIFIFAKNNSSSDGDNNSNLFPIDKITHGHGLSVDIANPNKVYIATHNGLLVLMNDKDLYRIGKSKDDYMGFSPHPSDPKVFFTSGHPSFGGNIGFQKSEDGGITWNKISNGVDGPVDFHAMAVSPANPNLIFGWYKGNLQRSNDGGKNWEIVNRNLLPLYLTADPKDENIIYAATQQGILVSKNKGVDWSSLSKDLEADQVFVLAINPQNSQKMLSYSEKLGLVKSTDSGLSWQKVNVSFEGEVLFIAIDKQNPNIVYSLSHHNFLYKSLDGGDSWNKIR